MKKIPTLVAFLLFFLSACATVKSLGEGNKEVPQEQAGRPVTPPPAHIVSPSPATASTSSDSQPVGTQTVSDKPYKEPTRAQIRLVQHRLKASGFNPGPIDGIFGAKTKAALRGYQDAHGLSHNGALDVKTLRSLGAE